MSARGGGDQSTSSGSEERTKTPHLLASFFTTARAIPCMVPCGAHYIATPSGVVCSLRTQYTPLRALRTKTLPHRVATAPAATPTALDPDAGRARGRAAGGPAPQSAACSQRPRYDAHGRMLPWSRGALERSSTRVLPHGAEGPVVSRDVMASAAERRARGPCLSIIDEGAPPARLRGHASLNLGAHAQQAGRCRCASGRSRGRVQLRLAFGLGGVRRDGPADEAIRRGRHSQRRNPPAGRRHSSHGGRQHSGNRRKRRACSAKPWSRS